MQYNISDTQQLHISDVLLSKSVNDFSVHMLLYNQQFRTRLTVMNAPELTEMWLFNIAVLSYSVVCKWLFLIDMCIVLIAYPNLLYHLKLWRNSSVDCHVDLSSFLRYNFNKNLCGRDGSTICGPQCVPKSTSMTLAVDEKTLPMATITGRTDRRTDRVRRNMRPPPREEGRIIMVLVTRKRLCK